MNAECVYVGCKYEHVLFHLNYCIIYILHHCIGWSGEDETIAQRKGSADENVHSFI